MKFFSVLAAAPLAAAFVAPDQEVFAQLATESSRDIKTSLDRVYGSVKEDIKDVGQLLKNELSFAKKHAQHALDRAIESSHDVENILSEEASSAQSWAHGSFDRYMHHAMDDRPDHGKPPHRRPHKKHPHHGHHKPNQTVYELIASSKYTTKLAKLLNDYPDLVEALNGTAANYTVFAPTDRAFEKIPEKAPKPSKEFLKKILTYHVSSEFYPAGRVLASRTIPTLLGGDELAEEPFPFQRVSVNIGLRGLTLNYYARIVAIDIFGTNGVIHGLDSLLLLPPRTTKIIDLLPTEFSTLDLALTKTGLLDELAENPTKGGTLFAPNNFAFAKLGPRVNAFLFSKYGQKYLKALLKYHIVPSTTLYSDAIYKASKEEEQTRIPKGRLHLDLPTLLENRTLAVDVARFGRFVGIHVNGFSRVTGPDGIARDGVIHIVSDVLVPPRRLPDGDVVIDMEGEVEADEQGEMCLGEFKRRLEPYVE